VKVAWANAHFLAHLAAPRTYLGLGDEDRVARAALFAFVQITADFVFLAALLHLCGGIESPLAAFFVFHVLIASILLSRRATYLATTVGFLLYAAVVLGESSGVLDHYPLGWVWGPGAYRTWSLAGPGLAVLGVTLYLASYLCSTIAVDLRMRVRGNVLLSRHIAGERLKLEAAYEKLQESEHTKSQYMRKVAHELRGPLGTIETALKVVLQDMAGGLSEPSRDLIGRAQRRAGELAAVTHDLLVLARAREAAVGQERVRVEVGALVQEVIEDFRESAARKDVRLSATVVSGGVVLGDRVALRQMVANLVENGIRYTKPGGSVSAAVRAQDRDLVVSVEDTGIGIAAEDLPRIFDEFYRGAQARAYAEQGTGLGLAITRVIVEQHGGRVAVDSQPGRGTRFEATVPTAG